MFYILNSLKTHTHTHVREHKLHVCYIILYLNTRVQYNISNEIRRHCNHVENKLSFKGYLYYYFTILSETTTFLTRFCKLTTFYLFSIELAVNVDKNRFRACQLCLKLNYCKTKFNQFCFQTFNWNACYVDFVVNFEYTSTKA